MLSNISAITWIEGILEAAVFNSVKSAAAQRVLRSRNLEIVEAAAECAFFERGFSRLRTMARDSAEWERSIGSFVEVMEVALCMHPEMVSESFCFFGELVDFAGVYSVDLVMCNFLSNAEELAPLHVHLKDSGFVRCIAERIGDCRALRVSDRHLASLFHYMLLCSRNDILGEDCVTPSALNVILKTDTDDSGEVRMRQWELIYELCMQNNVNIFVGLLESAIEVFDASGEAFLRCDEHIVNFITKILKFKPMAFLGTNIDLLCECLKMKIMHNQNNTIAFKAINQLVLVGIRCKETCATFINSFINFYLKLFRNTDNRIVHSFCSNLLIKISETCEYNYQLEKVLQDNQKYVKVMQRDIKNISSILHQSYGQDDDFDEPISSPII